MSEHKITVPGGESVRLLTAGKYCDRDIVVTAEGGTAPEDLDEVLTEQENLIAELQEALRGKGSAWYDAHWDAYQENGKRVSYAGAFSGRGWTEKTFMPKYPVKLTGTTVAERMFAYFNQITSLADRNNLFEFAPYNDWFDFSGAQRLEETFANARIKNLIVDASSAVRLYGTFSAGNGGSIDGVTLRVTSKCTNFTTLVAYQYCLVDFHLTDDSEIAESVGFGHCRELSKASFYSVFRALSLNVSGKTISVNASAVDTAFETSPGANDGRTSDEWLELVGTRPNWSVTVSNV